MNPFQMCGRKIMKTHARKNVRRDVLVILLHFTIPSFFSILITSGRVFLLGGRFLKTSKKILSNFIHAWFKNTYKKPWIMNFWDVPKSSALDFFPDQKKILLTRWAPTSYKWSYNTSRYRSYTWYNPTITYLIRPIYMSCNPTYN